MKTLAVVVAVDEVSHTTPIVTMATDALAFGCVPFQGEISVEFCYNFEVDWRGSYDKNDSVPDGTV